MTNKIDLTDYDSKKYCFPPLIGNKVKSREKLEEDPYIQNLIKSGLLLEKDLNSLLYAILTKTKELNELLLRGFSLSKKKIIWSSPFVRHRIYMNVSRKKIRLPKTRQEFQKYLKDETIKEIKKENMALRKKIKGTSDKIQDLLKDFEEKIGQELKIMPHMTIGFCPTCYNLVFKESFKKISCICGHKISRSADIKQLPVYLFNEDMINFVEQNRWLEHGIDDLFQKKSYKSLCGYSLLGSSGILHELDNIAESRKEKRRIFGECKTKPVGANDILTLNGKMLDIGCSEGYIFTTSSDINDTIKQLAKSRNITVVDSILERKNKELLKLI